MPEYYSPYDLLRRRLEPLDARFNPSGVGPGLAYGQLLSILADYAPGIGDIKSGVDAIGAAQQGDLLGAGLAGIGVLPMIGSIKGYRGTMHPEIRNYPKQKLLGAEKEAVDPSFLNVFRGAPDASLAPRSFPGTFVTTNQKNAETYGNLHKYALNAKAKLLDGNTKEAYSLSKEFVKKNPEIDAWLNTDVYQDPAELFMFPSPEWTSFLKEKGYEGTKFGEDIFIFESSYNKLKELLGGN